MTHRCAARLTPLLSALLALAACSRAARRAHVETELATIVAPEAAPGLAEPEGDEASVRTLYRGDVVVVTERGGPLAWEGELDDARVRLEGTWVGVRRAPGDGTIFTLGSTVGAPARVATAAALCASATVATKTEPLGCAQAMQRIWVDDGLTVGFVPCSTAACPVGVIDGGAARWGSLDGLQSLRLRSFGGKTLLFATRVWAEPGGLTGASLTLLDPRAALTPVGDVTLDRVDVRDKVHSRVLRARARVEASEIVVEGEEQTFVIATGARTPATPVRARYRLGAGGALTRD